MFQIIEKYKIKKIDDFLLNTNVKNVFKKIDINNLKNLIIYGSKGSGKKSLLYSLFNYPNKKKKTIKYKINKEILITFYKNNYFLEFDAKEFSIYDKFILKDKIKDIIITKNVLNNNKKIIVLHNADYLSKNAQIILKIMCEKFTNNCNFILICENINNIIEKLKSVFIAIRIPNVNEQKINLRLNEIIKNNNIKILEKNKKKIIKNHKSNFKKMINNIDYYNNTNKILSNRYEDIIDELVILIKKKIISKKLLNDITKNLYTIIMDYKEKINYVISDILTILIEDIKDNNKLNDIIDLAYNHDFNLKNGSKEIIHLESFFFNLLKILSN